jgi:prohibitin 2
LQDKRSTIIRAQGEALSAENFGKAIEGNPAYIDLKRIEAARDIARMLGQSRNKVYLDSDSLLLNLTSPVDNMLVSGSSQAPKMATSEKSQV